jgi:hypothetical protein
VAIEYNSYVIKEGKMFTMIEGNFMAFEAMDLWKSVFMPTSSSYHEESQRQEGEVPKDTTEGVENSSVPRS